jgi:hypothetical protein
MKKLSKLEIDLQGNFTCNRSPIRGTPIPIGGPALIFGPRINDQEFDELAVLEEAIEHIPKDADSYVTGATLQNEEISYKAIQFYRIRTERGY